MILETLKKKKLKKKKLKKKGSPQRKELKLLMHVPFKKQRWYS